MLVSCAFRSGADITKTSNAAAPTRIATATRNDGKTMHSQMTPRETAINSSIIASHTHEFRQVASSARDCAAIRCACVAQPPSSTHNAIATPILVMASPRLRHCASLRLCESTVAEYHYAAAVGVRNASVRPPLGRWQGL